MPDDGFKFPKDFLDRIGASGEVDETVIRELFKLTPDQREELASLLLNRNAERHNSN